jgi:hypothetical protein
MARKTVALRLAVTMVAAGALLALPTSAAGLGNTGGSCGSGNSYWGVSTSGWAGSELTGGDCGTLGARSMYRLPTSSTTYYTNWVYHPKVAKVTQTGTVGGKHWNSKTGETLTT